MECCSEDYYPMAIDFLFDAAQLKWYRSLKPGYLFQNQDKRKPVSLSLGLFPINRCD